MSRKVINLVGQKFGRWTVIQRAKSGKRNIKWECRCDCGALKSVYSSGLKAGTSQSCGCLAREIAVQRRGPDHPRWKGGRDINSGGYVRLVDHIHPNRTKENRILEHIKVMSNYLGRPLINGENVHHINGIRDDNRIENLELWVSSQPSGQRVEDLVAWAEEILSLYKIN